MKKIRDYTLGEAQDMCNSRKGACKLGEDRCRFVNENSMCKLRSMVGPSKFDLTDSPPFTNDQLVIMKELYKCGIRYIGKCNRKYVYLFANKPVNESGAWIGVNEDYDDDFSIPGKMFSQINIYDKEPIRIADYINIEEIK